jgi:uncharacterized damage-inducible protein DinB
MEVLAELFDHIIEGYDAPTPAGMLRVGAADAATKVPGMPYSLATNLRHTVTWQDFWLAKLAGGAQRSGLEQWREDFRPAGEDEWPELRSRFLRGLEAARSLARARPFRHKCASDAEACETLLRIAVHGAYHVGQMNLLKRALRAAQKQSSSAPSA